MNKERNALITRESSEDEHGDDDGDDDGDFI